jgi:TonB family protein
MRILAGVMAGVLCAFALSATCAAAAASPAPAQVTNPDWEKIPNGDDFAARFPPQALEAGKGGRADIECKVAAEGFLKNCRVVSETPKGEGFGNAALAMAWDFKMKPQSVDGKPVEGASVHIPIRFTVPKSETLSEAVASAAKDAVAGDASAASDDAQGENAQPTPKEIEKAFRYMGAFMSVAILVSLGVMLLLFIWPMSKIFRRAGISPALAWLFMVPGVSLFAPWIAVMVANEDEAERSNRLVS